MAHVRTRVRDDIALALANMTTPTAIYKERIHAVDAEAMPFVVVRMGDDESQDDGYTMGEPLPVVEVTQTLLLELHASGADGEAAAALVDQLDLESESEIAAAWVDTLRPYIEDIRRSSSAYETSAEQDRAIGLRTVEYAITWRHVFGAADSPESDPPAGPQ